MDTLPDYVVDQVPQSAFDALLTRIAAPLTRTHPDARAILESFVESQKAPAYNEAAKGEEPPKPIDHFPQYTEPDGSSGVDPRDPPGFIKKAIVEELFRAIGREDSQAIALLIQHNIVTANTTNWTDRDQTPLLKAVSANKVSIVKELLDLGADPNAFSQLTHYSEGNVVTRTPLMVAASSGSLPLVKLLFEPPYSADDTLVAPDGQIALRLAVENGHRAIVDYLPSRRAGHFIRFKIRITQNFARAKRALWIFYPLIRFFIWKLPKLFLWSVPKHVVVLPVVRSCKYCWSKRKDFASWCKHQLSEVSKRVWRTIKKVPRGLEIVGNKVWEFGTVTLPRWLKVLAHWIWELSTEHIPKTASTVLKWLWKGVKTVWQAVKKIPEVVGDVGKTFWEFVTVTLPGWLKNLAIWAWELVTKHIPEAVVNMLKWTWEKFELAWKVVKKVPKAVADIGKALWEFVTVTLPGWLKNLAIWIWELSTQRIPKAVLITVKWLWEGIKSFGWAVWEVISKFISFLHTISAAITTFMRNVTLMDVWNAFRDFLSAVFITFPKTLWSWIRGFRAASYKVMVALFGSLGELMWNICYGIVRLVTLIPRKLWIVLQAIWNTVVEGVHEVRVWFNPKARGLQWLTVEIS